MKAIDLAMQYANTRQEECPKNILKIKEGVSKSENTITLIQRVLKHILVVDYILADSWFINRGLIAHVYELSSLYLMDICKFDDR